MFQPGASLTFDNAKTALDAGLQAIADGQSVIDFAGLTVVDSAAVATLLAWRRVAAARAMPLTFINLPDNLRSLIALYDVAELLDSAAAAPAGAVPSSTQRTDLLHH
ncbi:MAG TPA: STAS domain-containing protein [Herminiimonas sp.]|jgi:phospholipid transport system transporter-binding protein|nr:STAS domain-containing protein [Herminiimonas sp.]